MVRRVYTILMGKDERTKTGLPNRPFARILIPIFLLFLVLPGTALAAVPWDFGNIGVSARWAFGRNWRLTGGGPVIGVEYSQWIEFYKGIGAGYYVEPGIEFNFGSGCLTLYTEAGSGLGFFGLGAGPFIQWSFPKSALEAGVQGTEWMGLFIPRGDNVDWIYLEPRIRFLLTSKDIDPSLGLVGKMTFVQPAAGSYTEQIFRALAKPK